MFPTLTDPAPLNPPRHRWVRDWMIGIGFASILATVCWFPALFDHRTLIQGDFSRIDVPLADLQMRMVQGQASALWVDGIYGGHPLFAEGQGGFAHPLVLLWALLVTPVLGPVPAANAIHWLLMIISGVGVFGLCRCLGARPAAALFAVLGMVLSTIWTLFDTVLPVALTLAWVPWSLWAFEAWWRRPSCRAAALLSLSLASLALSGYPQGLHGTLIYMAASLLVVPFQAEARQQWRETWRPRLGTVLLTTGLSIGLAAVQLLPLAELVALSHRSGGTPLWVIYTPDGIARGLLFASLDVVSNGRYFFPSVGSLLMCGAACLILALPRPSRITGHLLATLVLTQLGMGQAAPAFRFVYDHNLVPGLHYFRVVHLYLAFTALGIAVIGCFTIDTITRGFGAIDRRWQRSMGAALIVSGLGWAAYRLATPATVVIEQQAIAVVALVGTILLVPRAPKAIPLLMLACLVTDCAASRMQALGFFEPATLDAASTLALIQRQPNWQSYRTFDDSLTRPNVLLPPTTPHLDQRIRHMLTALPAMSGLAAGIPSINGPFALETARRSTVEPQLRKEIGGGGTRPPGQRLIDILGIRFITLDGPSAAGFKTLRQESDDATWLGENDAALPRFQLYRRAHWVSSPEDALAALDTVEAGTIVIEHPTNVAPVANDSIGGEDAADGARVEVIDAQSTFYRVTVDTPTPQWLFLRDANYPGWSATLDGQSTPLYSADVLGKAVAVPAGRHEIIIRFVSWSFRIGLCLSLCALGIAAALLVKRSASRRHPV